MFLSPDASTLSDKAFQPNSLEVLVGSTVIWTNDDFGIHTVTNDDGTFESDTLTPDDTFEFTLDEAGTYSYYCALHPTMIALYLKIVAMDINPGDICTTTSEHLPGES
jgi:plastocyanin